MNNYTIISNKSRLRPINKPKYCASFFTFDINTNVITYSNNPETKLHHVIKLDQWNASLVYVLPNHQVRFDWFTSL